jgi:hypothetical protein
MLRWLLSVAALSSLVALGGCHSCGSHRSSCDRAACGSGCGAGCGHFRSGGKDSACNWHGICDCGTVLDDLCTSRQPWIYAGRSPQIVDVGGHVVPANGPAAPTLLPSPVTRPMNTPN